MKLNELIKRLSNLKDAYGDSDIVIDINCYFKDNCYTEFLNGHLLNIDEIGITSGWKEENGEYFEVVTLS